jgi:exonuclease SbcC
MKPKKLRILNYGPYKDETIDLAAVPGALTAICGRNGEGKTMLLESLFFGVYREFPSRSAEDVYKFCTGRNAAFEFEFEMAGKLYRSIINLDTKTRKMEAVLAFDGQPLNDGKTGTFDEEIIKILGPMDQILASSFGAQDKKGNFVGLVKGKRKDLFIQMIGLNLLQQISARAGEHGNKFYADKSVLDGQLLVLNGEAQRTLPDLAPILKRVQDLSAGLLEYQTFLDDFSSRIAKQGAQYDKLPAMVLENKEKKANLSDLQSLLSTSESELKQSQDRAAFLPKIRLELVNARDTVSSMRESIILKRDKFSQLKDLQQKEQECGKKYLELKSECDGLTEQIKVQSDLSASLGDLRGKKKTLELDVRDSRDISTTLRLLNAEVVRLSQEEHEKSFALTVQRNHIESLVIYEAGVIKQLAEARSISARLKEVPCGGVGEYATCPLIKSAVDAGAQIDELQALVDNAKITILAQRQELDGMPKPDDDSKKRTLLQISDNNSRLSFLEADMKKLEPEVAKLPAAEMANSKIEDLGSVLAIKKQACDLASVDQESMEMAIQNIQQYSMDLAALEKDLPLIEARIVGFEKTIQDFESAASKIDLITANIDRIKGEVSTIESRVSSLSADIDSMSALKIQYDSDVSKWKELKDITIPVQTMQIDKEKALLAQAESEILSIGRSKEQAEAVQKQIDGLNYQLACYLRVSKTFGPMEIQSFEIDSAGPEVSRLANELLFNCFGPRFSIKFVTQEAKVDGSGYKDEFDVSVDDQKTGKVGSIGGLSGGEKSIVGEALSLAIALYNKEKSGIAWDTLFRDEVSGAMDEVYAPQYISMLRAAQTMGHFKKVYFICHQPELKEKADSRIIVSGGHITVEA